MPEDKTPNYNLKLIQDEDSLKSAVKTKPNANMSIIDSKIKEQDDEISLAWKDPGNVVNLCPFFLVDFYNQYLWSKYLDISKIGSYEQLDDGWLRFNKITGNEVELWAGIDFFPWMGEAGSGKIFTFIAEVRNNLTANPSGATLSYYASQNSFTVIPVENWPFDLSESGTFHLKLTRKDAQHPRSYEGFCPIIRIASDSEGTLDIRFGIVEGEYTGQLPSYDPRCPEIVKQYIDLLDPFLTNTHINSFNTMSSQITFHRNDGSDYTFVKTGWCYQKIEDHISTTSSLVKRSGYTFKGFSTSPNSSSGNYYLDSQWPIHVEELNLYSIWEAE